MKRLALFTACFICLSHASAQESKVYRAVSNETLEKILQAFEIKYEKAEERKDKDVAFMFFDFKRGEQTYRLNNYIKDLWLECVFEKSMKAEEINRWNAEAKFSRLVQVVVKDKSQKEKTYLSLEAQLDCGGGVTDAIIRQFITRFEAEAQKFAKFK